MTYTPGCWFARNVIGCGPCDGQLVRAHLIPQQVLKRETKEARRDLCLLLDEVLSDPRSWVPCCGGPTGIGGHHGMLDHSRTLRIPRAVLPKGLEAFAAELGLEWWLDREYGPREKAA
jgi:hypothetical protein